MADNVEYLALLQELDRRRQHAGQHTTLFTRTAKQAEQAAAVYGPARHVLAYGGARSGKTFGFCEVIAERALQAPNSRHLIARLHNIDVRQSVMLDTWPKMMGLAFPDVAYKMNKSDQYITLPDGSEVWFTGLDDKERVDKILGKEFATIYVNESSQVGYETIMTLRTRLAQNATCRDGSTLPLKAVYDLNPTGRQHWTYREFIDGVNPVDGRHLPMGSRAFVHLNPADNPHLPSDYIKELDELPDRQRQRFRDGKYLSELPDALWSVIDRTADDGRIIPGMDSLRVQVAPEKLKRIVVAVDPSGSDGTKGDYQGIIVAGLGVDGHAYILADRSCRKSPEGWARVAVNAYEEFKADQIVAERNFGGEMVTGVIQAVSPNVPIRLVNASRGKIIRAEPVAAFYEKGRVHHVGAFPLLEEQMCMTTTDGYKGGGSPDRMDALVWAITELIPTGGTYNIRNV